MKDENRTKKQLIKELKELRYQFSKLKVTESRHEQARDDLQESDAKYRELVQNANSIILRMDLKGNVTFFNEFAQRFFGYSESEIIGRNVLGTIVPEVDYSGRDLAAMIEDIGSQPELYKNNENENMCRNGKRVWISWTNRGIYDKNGNISEILCIGNDITERKRTEKELGETKDYLYNIIESSLDCIVVSDNGGHISKANKSFLNLLGYKEGEIIGKMMPEFQPTKVGTLESTTGEPVEIDKAFLDETSERVSRFLRDGKITNWETYLVLKNKKVVPVDINIVLLYDDGRNRIGAVGVLRNITERRKAEKEIIEAKDFLDNIFRTSADGIVVTDQHGYITMVNEATEKMLGYTKGGLIGKHTGELSLKGNNYEKRVKEIVSELFEEGIIADLKHSWLRKDGSLIDFEISVALLKDKKGNTIGSVGSIRDITERKQAEKKLLEYQNRLKSLASQLTLAEQKDRRRFATYLHDQVGQALFISKLKLGTIKEQVSTTDTTESLEEIINIIEQAIKETRSLTFELSPPILYQLGLEAALEWLVEQMQEQYGMAIYFEDDKRSKPLEESVRILLFRAVRELLINVSKHAKAQNVKLTTRRDGENIKIFVEDDGVGFTVLKNGSSNHENDGFGLFNIEERLDSLGGYLKIESEVGLGACFTITAPLNSKKGN